MKLQDERVQCDICGSEDNSILNERKPWTASPGIRDDEGGTFHKVDVICNECGLVFKNPMLTQESQEEYYRTKYAEEFRGANIGGISKGLLHEGISASVMILKFLEDNNFNFEGKSVYEIGAGMGCLLKAFSSMGASTVDGCEPDLRANDICNKLFALGVAPITFSQRDQNGKYDLIVLANALEHFRSPKETLLEVRKMLNPGGNVLLELPSIERLYSNTTIDGFLSSAHNYTFSIDTVSKLVALCRFKIDFWGYNGHKGCMLIMLSQDESPQAVLVKNFDEDKKLKLIKYIQNHQAGCHDKSGVAKELLSNINVYSSILSKIEKDYQPMINFYRLSLAQGLMERGHLFEARDLLKTFDPDQSWDEDICEGSRLYLLAVIARQLGDFIKSRDLLIAAMKAYPPYRKYNFTKDLTIDGVLSDTVYSQKLWWNAERVLGSLG